MKNILHSPVRAILKAWKITPAFSLVEMLMALLVASLLMAALAPVMTRKMNEHIQVSNTANIKTPYDLQCYPYTDANPAVTVPLNNVYYANFIMASGGGGGAGATSANKAAQTPIQITGTTERDTTQEIVITEYMTDVKLTLAGGGGGGAGGAGYVSACPTGTIEFSGSSALKKFCMTKYNIGEYKNQVQTLNYAYIPKCPSCSFYSSTDVSAGYANKCGTGSAKCCWYAGSNSADSYTANNLHCSTYGYNACVRTLCNYEAAKSGCEEFTYVPSGVQSASWQLPTYEQAAYLGSANYSSSKGNLSSGPGNASIWLCSSSSISGADLCSGTLNRCYNGNENACQPAAIWLSREGSNAANHAWLMAENNTVALYLSGATDARRSFSTRCTLDKTNLFRSYSGAGGSAGAYIADLDITQYIKQAGVNGRIIITAGKAGKGGNGASSNNTKANDGTAGSHSQVIIKKQTGEIIYGVRVSGGNSGSAAQSITPTSAAASNSSSFPDESTSGCQYTSDGTNWKSGGCTKWTLMGNGGEAVWGSNASAPYAKGGQGAHSPLTSSGGGNGGTGDNSTTLNGSAPVTLSYPGAGGGGGSSIYGYSDKITAGKGGNGAGGLARITYNNEYAAAGGGGGGAGSVVQVKNIYVGNKTECTLTIGKGGKGGGVDNDGMDGSLSSVKCDNDARIFAVKGGKGGKKGTASSGINVNPSGGSKGAFGDADTYIYSLDPEKRVIKKGLDGMDGSFDSTNGYSIGGRGGTGGTGTKGACGGLYTETGICEVSETDINRINGKGFEYTDVVTPLTQDIQNTASPSFGKASAGGGAGGWTRELGSGKGGDGMNGYVCVYWYGDEE